MVCSWSDGCTTSVAASGVAASPHHASPARTRRSSLHRFIAASGYISILFESGGTPHTSSHRRPECYGRCSCSRQGPQQRRSNYASETKVMLTRLRSDGRTASVAPSALAQEDQTCPARPRTLRPGVAVSQQSSLRTSLSRMQDVKRTRLTSPLCTPTAGPSQIKLALSPRSSPRPGPRPTPHSHHGNSRPIRRRRRIKALDREVRAVSHARVQGGPGPGEDVVWGRAWWGAHGL